jgi:hypothetical protein
MSAIGWDKPVSQYEKYVAQQAASPRSVVVATSTPET